MFASSNLRAWFIVAASLLVCFGMWFWSEKILVPANSRTARTENKPVGNVSDLYPRWLGARELLLHGRDPYSAEITKESQIGFYGRPLDPHNPQDPSAQESFVYPVYTVFLLSPTVTLPFRTVQQLSRWSMLLMVACMVPLWMRAIGFHPQPPLIIAGMVLAVSSYPAILEFHQQNLAAVVFFFLAAASAAVACNWFLLGGVLLAFATIKPEISGLFILWLIFWAASKWRMRQRLIWSFFAAMLALFMGSEAILSHWMTKFAAALHEYPSYGGDPSLLKYFLPSGLALFSTFVLLAVLIFYSWRWRDSAAASQGFSWNLAWVVTVTLVILPKQAGYNQLLLLPALLVLMGQKFISPAGLLARAMTKGAFACQIWQWAAALLLTLFACAVPASKLSWIAYAPLQTMTALTLITFFAVIFRTRAIKN